MFGIVATDLFVPASISFHFFFYQILIIIIIIIIIIIVIRASYIWKWLQDLKHKYSNQPSVLYG